MLQLNQLADNSVFLQFDARQVLQCGFIQVFHKKKVLPAAIITTIMRPVEVNQSSDRVENQNMS